MNYRWLTRLFAMLYLLLSMFGLVVIIFLAYTIMVNIFLRSDAGTRSQLTLLWVIFGVLLLFCSLYIIASRRLLLATREDTHPESARKLCALWLQLSWTTVGIALIWFTVETIILVEHLAIMEFRISYSHILNIAIILLQMSGMLCVYKFKKETEIITLDYITETEAMIHLTQAAQRASQRSLPPPSYDSLKFSETESPPPYSVIIAGGGGNAPDPDD